MPETLTRLLSYQEAAEHLGVTTKTIQRMVKRGELGCVRINGRTYIREDELQALIDRNTIPGDFDD